MLTTGELNKKLAELNIEFCKLLNTDNITDMFRWVSVAMEFLEAILTESAGAASLTQDELMAVSAAKALYKNHHENIQHLLKMRIAREREIK